MKNPNIDILLLDLGGVLVDLPGTPFKPEWFTHDQHRVQNQTLDTFWHHWLHSETVHALDQGKISPEVFIARLIDELSLNVEQRELFDYYRDWPGDFYPGILALLERLSQQYQLAIFSNISALHWPQYHRRLQQQNIIKSYFASYQMGHSKPYPEAFQYVLDSLNVAPDRILFIDDNQINVKAGQDSGMQAAVTPRGQLQETLIQLNVL